MKHPDLDARLAAYEDLVAAWADRIDLVSPGDLGRFAERHVADCLRALPLLQSLPEGPAIDVGSGVGLPGIVLALADPTRRWVLLEPRTRRAAFLEEAIRALEIADCEVVALTAQEAAARAELGAAHAFATARALAPPRTAFALSMPLVAPGGAVAVFVGSGADIPAEAELWAPGLAIVRVRPDGSEKTGRR